MRYEIGGARGSVEDHEAILKTVQSWARPLDGEVLLADARVVFGRDHLETAVRHALRAQAAGTMSSRSVSMESLRYLAGQRQIADAIRTAGIRAGVSEIAIVLFGELRLDDLVSMLGWKRDDRILGPGRKPLETFGISKVESETLPAPQRLDLVLEKVALLDIDK